MVHNVLVTGGNGFIGRRLVAGLLAAGANVRCAVRSRAIVVPGVPDVLTVGAIGPTTDWGCVVTGTDVVFHIAGATELGRSSAPDEFELVNAQGTRVLAEAAAAAGVKRFVLLSTIGVNGANSNDKPFTEDDTPNPTSRYAASKLAAESSLRDIASSSKMEWCIVRAPMVYGAAAPGKFSRLVALVRKRWPLPLGAAVAKKSFISVENLSSLLVQMAFHPNAANCLWLASDGEDTSTADFVRCIGEALGRPARLVYVPKRIMHGFTTIVGRGAEIDSLFDPLQIDSSRVQKSLTWAPPLRLMEGIKRAVREG